MKIALKDRSIEVNVQYGRREKLSMHMDSLGYITVKVPKNTSHEVIIRAVQAQSDWIEKRLEILLKAQEITKAKTYHEKGKFLYLGKEYFLDELIEVDESEEEALKRKLRKFYVSSCKKIVTEKIKGYQKELGVKPKSIEIVDTKAYWGSCSQDKKLTFNYRLAMAPVDVIEYVIIHELSHLKHMNHDRSFWRCVGSIMPDYKDKQAFLERYGAFMTL